jgi:hypothetical protein
LRPRQGRVRRWRCRHLLPSELYMKVSLHTAQAFTNALRKTRLGGSAARTGLSPCPSGLPGPPSRYAPGAGERSVAWPASYWRASRSERRGTHQHALPPPTSAFPRAGWSSSLVTEDPREVSPLARGVMSSDGSTPIRPVTGRRSLAPSSHARLCIGRPCGSPTPKGQRRVYHVPPMYREKVRSRLSAGGASSACGKFGTPQPVPLPFGPGLSAPLACHQ